MSTVLLATVNMASVWEFSGRVSLKNGYVKGFGYICLKFLLNESNFVEV